MKTPQPPTETTNARANAITTFCIVAGCSILFCSKGIFAKLAYRDGADALAVLTLRMVFALPFFAAIVLVSMRNTVRISVRDLAELVALGFVGYYFSALVNFTGLQYVSVGLERIILYTYPTIVLVISAFLLRKKVRPAVWFASLIAWIGIVAAFIGETRNPAPSGNTGFGALLIFVSALSYACFLMMSGRSLNRFGPTLFTGMAVGISCVLVIVHYAVARPVATLFELPASVYLHAGVLCVFGTVAPAILMSEGLKRAGTQKFAVISCIGPVATLFLAWAILDERPNFAQTSGFALTVLGGLLVSVWKEKPPVTNRQS